MVRSMNETAGDHGRLEGEELVLSKKARKNGYACSNLALNLSP